MNKCNPPFNELNSGSDVAKEAGVHSMSLSTVHCLIYFQSASIILLNNDFSSIPVAIELGRLVFDNLKKVILYLMPVCNPSFQSP
jgi:magnesium-transporting ATPase (P-type)